VTGDSPFRDLSSILCIAEIVCQFDVVAVQEVRESAQAFLLMMKAVGEGWAFLVTDVTRGKEGNMERLFGGLDDDRLYGQKNDVVLDGEEGTDELDGGLGTDTCRNGESVVACET
jgi:hypothetical protein